MTVLDIGANIGCHTLRFAKLVGESGKVIAFEPVSWAFSKLKRNTELNDFSNITLEKLALSDVVHRESARFRSSWTVDEGCAPDSMDSEDVDFVTLDEYVGKNNVDRIDLIKLDVDGYEYKVICGGRETIGKCKPTMIIEFCKWTLKKYGDNLEDLVDLLASLGYSFYSEKDLRRYDSKEVLLNAVPEGATINVVCQVIN